ncbi:MAG: hypothetical protein FJ272_12690, partial [Planctomycetes bacterium]|nr:hypothetical protein [Planctomycetota bacterium]
MQPSWLNGRLLRYGGKPLLTGALLMGLLMSGQAHAQKATGPLRVHPTNPRYFTDGSGKAIYLTGAHTWANLQDMGQADPPRAFDYKAHLDFLEKHHHNFIRLWRWEFPRWKDNYDKFTQFHYCAPHPWKRTGPGNAQDGKPKFDLEQLDPAYFERLRARVSAAGDRGIYVSIMLFEGWALQFALWDGHPFHVQNNVNRINGDPNGDGKGLETHTLQVPAMTRIQEAYVRKVVDTVNDLDNVIYEIANESHKNSVQWQYHVIRFIHDYEKQKPKQHPVGMTTHGQMGNPVVFDSPAEWVSPAHILEWRNEKDPYKV